MERDRRNWDRYGPDWKGQEELEIDTDRMGRDRRNGDRYGQDGKEQEEWG